jgi:long-chain acyl-CoA synthetase
MLVTIKEFEALCRCVLAGRGDPCGLILLDEIMDCAPAQEKRSAEEVINIDSGYVQAGDPVIFQYTSGSTGRPKRVSRTHSNLIFELKSLAKTLGLSEQDKFLGVVPFSHVNGLVRSMLASLSVGGTLFPLREFKRQKVISTIQEEGISIFIGVPFMFNILADTDLRRPIDFSSLRLCVSASAPMPAAANRKFRQKYGHYVRQLYGSTETGTISVNMSRDIESSIESVGLPIERVEVAIFRDKGALGNNGEIGEVAVKSAAAMAGYDGLSEEEQPFRNGYFLTGDLGRIDHDGHLYLVGRKKFFINKGGYKINPWELEALLATHSKIKEVVVIGVPTPYGDERVKAVIVPRVACTEEEIIEYCKGRIADFKVPSLIEFRRSLPKSSVGKVLRRKLE